MKTKGFTLIELLAVILILGIIALIAVPKVSDYVEAAKEETYKHNVETIIDAARDYVIKYNISDWIVGEDNFSHTVLTITELQNKGLLEQGSTIDPKTNEQMVGCVLITLDSNDRYTYEYDDECQE